MIALLLRLVERVHHAAQVGGPCVLQRAVQQQAVDVLDAQLAAVAIEGLDRLVLERRAIPGHLRLDEEPLARKPLDGHADHLVDAVVVSRVDVGHPAFDGIAYEAGEALLAQPSLHVAPIAAGADAEPCHPHARPAEGHHVGRTRG